MKNRNTGFGHTGDGSIKGLEINFYLKFELCGQSCEWDKKIMNNEQGTPNDEINAMLQIGHFFYIDKINDY